MGQLGVIRRLAPPLSKNTDLQWSAFQVWPLGVGISLNLLLYQS